MLYSEHLLFCRTGRHELNVQYLLCPKAPHHRNTKPVHPWFLFQVVGIDRRGRKKGYFLSSPAHSYHLQNEPGVRAQAAYQQKATPWPSREETQGLWQSNTTVGDMSTFIYLFMLIQKFCIVCTICQLGLTPQLIQLDLSVGVDETEWQVYVFDQGNVCIGVLLK